MMRDRTAEKRRETEKTREKWETVCSSKPRLLGREGRPKMQHKGKTGASGVTCVTVFWVYPQEWYCWVKW
jgi:hypothetical protein